MSVDDIAAQGAEPLFFLDYISIGKLVPEEIDEIVAGVAEGCRQARCALLGGEMSEHPGVMEPGEFDLVGFAVGVVERAEVLPRDVRAGDRIVGFASPGLRCNGYSLARAALLDRGGHAISTSPAWPGAHHSLAEELLEPSVIYAPAMLEARARGRRCTRSRTSPAAASPATSCGCCPTAATASSRRGTWEEPRIFAEIQRAGDVPDDEMEHVFNLGLGMLAVVAGRRGRAGARRRAGRGPRRLDRRRDRRRPRPGPRRNPLIAADRRTPVTGTRASFGRFVRASYGCPRMSDTTFAPGDATQTGVVQRMQALDRADRCTSDAGPLRRWSVPIAQSASRGRSRSRRTGDRTLWTTDPRRRPWKPTTTKPS